MRRATGEAAYPSEAGEYYWGGAGGTYMWVDPKSDMFVVFMMQSPKHRSHYRSLIRNMVYAAVLKERVSPASATCALAGKDRCHEEGLRAFGH